MRPAILETEQRPKLPMHEHPRAPQIELELPLVAPEDSPAAPKRDPSAERGIAVINFYL